MNFKGRAATSWHRQPPCSTQQPPLNMTRELRATEEGAFLLKSKISNHALSIKYGPEQQKKQHFC